jgi:hypothetical protein
MFAFMNRRADAWWAFREMLDPDQEGGSPICLPPDPELRSDLTSPMFEIGPNGIKVESKKDIKKRLGRSPGKGDVAVMLFAEGDKAIKRGLHPLYPGMSPASTMTKQSVNPNRGRYSRYAKVTGHHGVRGSSGSGDEQG